MSESIKVSVTGCSGRMGRAAVAAINSDPELDLVSGVDVIELGSDIGELAGLDPLGITVSEDLASTLKKSGAHVAVDFTHPSVVLDNVKITIQSGVSPVVGTTGWNDDMLASIQELCNAKNVPAFICPNFAIGAVLMMKFAAEAAPYMERVEIIELHHDAKADSPSGTATKTADMILKSRGSNYEPIPIQEEIKLPDSRGGNKGNVRIHSVRLPGFVAHQEVIFGGVGQTLTIRHDTTGRDSFMPGVILAIKKVRSLKGLVNGLENLL